MELESAQSKIAQREKYNEIRILSELQEEELVEQVIEEHKEPVAFAMNFNTRPAH
jgi:hypothetical protein